MKLKLLLLFALIASISLLSAMESILIDFDVLNPDTEIDGVSLNYSTTVKNPEKDGLVLDGFYSLSPEEWSLLPGLDSFYLFFDRPELNTNQIDSFKCQSFRVSEDDWYLPNESVLKFTGVFDSFFHDVRIRLPFDIPSVPFYSEDNSNIDFSMFGLIHDVSLPYSFSILLKNTGSPLYIVLVLVDEFDNPFILDFGLIDSVDGWIEYSHVINSYWIVRNFPEVKFDFLSLKQINISSASIQDRILNEERLTAEMTDEEMYHFYDYKESRLSAGVPWESEPVELYIKEISLIHHYEHFEEWEIENIRLDY
ncbi:MAG: hypothetical protein JEY99_16160 [Spirochaetales bacterium]|nr:hypothetical protein [Spirochaetales bacterium]